jgi:hypothetical protein
MRFRNGSDKGTEYNFMQIPKTSATDPGSEYTSVRGRKHEPYTESPNSQRPKKATGEEQSERRVHHLFDIKGIVPNESILAGQTVNSVYYFDV